MLQLLSMGKYETFPGSGHTPKEIYHLKDNRTQATLIKFWAEKQGGAIAEGHNETTLAWINSGMAAKFRNYVENHGDEEIHTDDETELAELLEALDGPTMH